MSEETEVVTNPIEDLIQSATTQDFSAASDIFNDIMSSKMADALEQQKIAVANRIYNGVEPEDEEISDEDLELDDEDLELDDEDLINDDEVEN